MGIVGKDYGNHSFPGRENGSVGYLIDDGRILDSENPTWGIACDGEKLNRAIYLVTLFLFMTIHQLN